MLSLSVLSVQIKISLRADLLLMSSTQRHRAPTVMLNQRNCLGSYLIEKKLTASAKSLYLVATCSQNAMMRTSHRSHLREMSLL